MLIKVLSCFILLPALCFGQQTSVVNLHSKVLKEDRKLWVSLPENYDLKKDRYQLVVLFDGDNRPLYNYTVATKRLLETNAVDLTDYDAPESIVIGVEQKDRYFDFVKNEAKFLQFLVTEILPYIDQHYRTLQFRVLIGHSLGGRFALQALIKHPAQFNAVIAASAAFEKKYTDTVIRQLDQLSDTTTKDRALYVVTTSKPGDATEQRFHEFALSLNDWYGHRKPGNFRFGFDTSATLAHGKSPYFAIPQGLHFIYEPRLWQLSDDSLTDKRRDPLSVFQHYQQVTERRFGVKPEMSNSYTQLIGAVLISHHLDAEAIAVMKARLSSDPTDLNLYMAFLTELKKVQDPGFSAAKAEFIKVMQKLQIAKNNQQLYLKMIH